MPFLKKPPKEPLSKVWDRKAQKCGLRHTVYWVNGDQYTGEWLDNKRHGKGINIWRKSGLIYRGDWKDGRRHGFGSLSKWNPGPDEYVKLYSGEWKNDKKDGHGSYYYTESAWYEGQWRKDHRSGWGRMDYENGDVYEGEWLNDEPHGMGVLMLANKNRYEGSWKTGKKHGPGKFYFLDKGQLYEGLWKDGLAKCGTVTDFGRLEAPNATPYPIPKVYLMNPNSVLLEAQAEMCEEGEKRGNGEQTGCEGVALT